MHFHVFLWLHRCWTGAFPVWPQEVLALLWGLWEEAGCLHFSCALSSVLHFPSSLHVNYLFCSYCDGERKEGTSTSFLSFNLTNSSIRDVYRVWSVSYGLWFVLKSQQEPAHKSSQSDQPRPKSQHLSPFCVQRAHRDHGSEKQPWKDLHPLL